MGIVTGGGGGKSRCASDCAVQSAHTSQNRIGRRNTVKRFDRANSQSLGLKGQQRTHHKIRSLAHSHKKEKFLFTQGSFFADSPIPLCDTIFQATGAPLVLRKLLLHP